MCFFNKDFIVSLCCVTWFIAGFSLGALYQHNYDTNHQSTRQTTH